MSVQIGERVMQFGMPTLVELLSLEECCILCKRLGLSFLELNMNLPMFQLDTIDRDECNRLSEQYGIFYTIHLDENLNVSDFNPYVAAAYMQTVRKTISLAKNIHAPIINMHLSKGVYFTLPERKMYLFDVYREHYLHSIRSFRLLCEEEIGDTPILICIENCEDYPPFQQEALEILLDSPVFGLTYDVGHNHSCGGLAENYILEHRGSLYHMHLHDAAGKKNHLALGTGEVDLDKNLSLAKERNCRVVLETKTVEGLTCSAEWIRKEWI